jgi:hypothetical protein
MRLFQNSVAAEDHNSRSERLLMGYKFVAGLGSQTRLKLYGVSKNMEPHVGCYRFERRSGETDFECGLFPVEFRCARVAVNRAQSRRFARFGDVRQSCQRLDCGRFSAAFAIGRTQNAGRNLIVYPNPVLAKRCEIITT